MNILILHGLGEEKNWISSWEDMELMFPKYDNSNNYLIHNCYLDLPETVKSFDFDAIIMMSTFMDWVKRYQKGDSWLNQYAFIKNARAKKIVYAQDDYWLSEMRDEFCSSNHIDLLFPFCSQDTWQELYPKFIGTGGKLDQGYTIYLTDKMLGLSKQAIPYEQRVYDIVYRASGIPTYPNKLGSIKATIGDTFEAALPSNHSLKLDFSTRTKSFISGNEWYDFVGKSKAMLGSNSGSSVNVRNHEVANRILNYKRENPLATYEEIEKLVLDPKDVNKTYTGISPRNIEAAMLGTLQILVHGEYGGILKPYEHYLPFEEDASNIEEILTILKDTERCLRITAACKEAFLNTKNLYAENVIAGVLDFIKTNTTVVNEANPVRFRSLQSTYNSELDMSKLKYKLKKTALGLKRKLTGK